MMRKLSVLITITIMAFSASAQDAVGINNDSPHSSAILDVESSTQGVLVPRMTAAQRDLISSPAQGLLIYNTSTNTFWFYNGSAWTEIVSSVSTDEIVDADGDTRVEVEQSSDDDYIRFTMRGTEYFRMDEGRLEVLNTGNSVFFGQFAGRVDNLSNNRNVFIGHSSGRFNTTGHLNVGIGYRSLNLNTIGQDNIALGEDALRRNTTGNRNIAIGSNALQSAIAIDSNIAIGYNSMTSLTNGNNNLAFGLSSMSSKTSGSNNVAIGHSALQNNISGSNNTVIGRQAGSNATGSGNVFIGYQAGRNETGDNKLYIESSNATTPLIYGEFDNDSLVINGDLAVTNNITYVGTLTHASDKRLKEDFDTLSKVMELVNQLQAYSYKMKGTKSEKREIGFIAQEVQKVFPEMVKTIDAKKGYIGVDYLQMVAILIEGLKEQQIIISDFRKKHGDSELRLKSLKAEVEQIKADINGK